jgi:hypothetical protein
MLSLLSNSFQKVSSSKFSEFLDRRQKRNSTGVLLGGDASEGHATSLKKEAA